MGYHITAVYTRGVSDSEKDSTELAHMADLNDRQQNLHDHLKAVPIYREYTGSELLSAVGATSVYKDEPDWLLPNDLVKLEQAGVLRLGGFRLVESSDKRFSLKNTTIRPLYDESGKWGWTIMTIQGPAEGDIEGGDLDALTYQQCRDFFKSYNIQL